MRQQLIELWQARNPRERMTLLIGGVLSLLLVLYLFVWDPITSDRERLLRDLPTLRARGAEFRRNADEAEAFRTRLKSRATGQPLPATIEASSKQANLGAPLRSVQSLSDDRAQVSGNGIQFDALVRWIATLAANDGIAVDMVQASAAPEPGRVQLDSLILKR